MSAADWQDVIVVIVTMACLGYVVYWIATWGRR